MSKRAPLWILAIGALGLAFVIAAWADAGIGSDSDCVGLLSFPHWFDEACKAARLVRLMALVAGTAVAAILVYVAEKDAESRSSVITWLLAVAKPFGSDEVVLEYHEMEWSSDNAHYHCTDCGYKTADEDEAETHRWQEAESDTAHSGR